MRPDQRRPVPTVAGQRNVIVLPVVVALAVLFVFVLRDGFGWGDVVGALAVGLGVLIALLAVRRFASR